MTIELRLTEVDPPAEEPHRTIYHDLASLPDPVIQGITIRYFNHDDVGLYFRITGSGTGYTFTPVNLGLLATGTNKYCNLDNFASRAKPSGEMGENITLTLKGYTDSGYSNLKWTFERIVQVIWINSADPAYTVDELDNFDDGTVQGWSGDEPTYFGVATDYVLSTPYSLRMLAWSGSGIAPFIYVKRDATVLTRIGAQSGYGTPAPLNKWIRLVVSLPSSLTFTLAIYDCLTEAQTKKIYKSITTSNRNTIYAIIDYRMSGGTLSYMWIDDFKIISK